MHCKEALTLLSGHMDQENTAAEEAELQAHLAGCPDCRAAWEAYRRIDRGVASLTAEPPEALSRGVMDQIHRPNKRRRFLFGGGTLAAAAVVALVILVAGRTGSLRQGAASTAAIPEPYAAAAPVEEASAPAVQYRLADARLDAADALALVEITDRADAPAAETVAPLAALTPISPDRESEYITDAATARTVVDACGGYDVTVPDTLSRLADDVPCMIRIVTPE